MFFFLQSTWPKYSHHQIKAIVLIGHVCPADSKCTTALIHDINLLHLQAI